MPGSSPVGFRLRLILILSILISVIPHELSAAAGDTTRVVFTRLNDYYQLQGHQKFFYNCGPWSYDLASSHFLRYYALQNTESRSKTENELITSLRRTFSGWRAGGEFKAFSLEDRLSGIDNDYYKYNAGFTVGGKENRILETALGVSTEHRQGVTEDGAYGRLHYVPGGEDLRGSAADIELEQHGPRRNDLYDLRYSRTGEIGQIGVNTFSAGYTEIRRDYYTDPLLTRETRLNISRVLQNSLRLNLPSRWGLRYRLAYSSDSENLGRQAAEDESRRNKDHFLLDNSTEIGKKIGRARLYSRFTLIQEQNSYSSSSDLMSPADYSTVKKDLAHGLRMSLGSGDSLNVSWQTSLYQFTTPDSENVDDRDELSHVLTLDLRQSLSGSVKIGMKGQVFYRHLMYLSSRRSAQNHVNRIYSLEFSQGLDLPMRLTLRGQQRIFANYFIYDYENLYPINYKSMVYRGIQLKETVNLQLSRVYSTSFSIDWKNEEDGFVNWDEFIQQTTVDRKYYRLMLLGRRESEGSRFEAGPYYHYRIDRRAGDGDGEVMLDPQRLGITVSMSVKRIFQLSWSIERLNSGGVYERTQQQGRIMLNFIFGSDPGPT